jgi:hypothetical protein
LTPQTPLRPIGYDRMAVPNAHAQELYEANKEAIMGRLRIVKLEKEIADLKESLEEAKKKHPDSLIYLALGTVNTIRSYLPSAIETELYDEETLTRIAHYCFDFYSDPINIMIMLDGQTKKDDTLTRVIEIMVREWWIGNSENFKQKGEE